VSLSAEDAACLLETEDLVRDADSGMTGQIIGLTDGLALVWHGALLGSAWVPLDELEAA
jgi:hypothetical protein